MRIFSVSLITAFSFCAMLLITYRFLYSFCILSFVLTLHFSWMIIFVSSPVCSLSRAYVPVSTRRVFRSGTTRRPCQRYALRTQRPRSKLRTALCQYHGKRLTGQYVLPSPAVLVTDWLALFCLQRFAGPMGKRILLDTSRLFC